jgi:hypothetical protein
MGAKFFHADRQTDRGKDGRADTTKQKSDFFSALLAFLCLRQELKFWW